MHHKLAPDEKGCKKAVDFHFSWKKEGLTADCGCSGGDGDGVTMIVIFGKRF